MERIGLGFTVVPLPTQYGGGRLVVISTGRLDTTTNTIECSGITSGGKQVMVPVPMPIYVAAVTRPTLFLEVRNSDNQPGILVQPNTGRIATDEELGIVHGLPIPKKL